MYKKALCSCKVVVLRIKPIVFLTFLPPSASLDLKVPIFTLMAASIPPLQNFMSFLQQKISPFVFSLSLSLLFSLSFAGLSLYFLCLSLSLYSKFVDVTIYLSLILQTTRIKKHFPLPVFVFIHSLVVASQHAGGHTFSRQKKMTFG